MSPSLKALQLFNTHAEFSFENSFALINIHTKKSIYIIKIGANNFLPSESLVIVGWKIVHHKNWIKNKEDEKIAKLNQMWHWPYIIHTVQTIWLLQMLNKSWFICYPNSTESWLNINHSFANPIYFNEIASLARLSHN